MDTPQTTQHTRPIWGKLAAISVVAIVAFTLFSQRRGLTSFVRNWEDFSDGSPTAKQLRDVDDVVQYILLHKADVSLVVYDVGDEAHGVFLNADRPRPLGSSLNLQLLAAYAARVERGALQPAERVPLAEWERLFLPRTDGGAHEFALRTLQVQGERVPLADIVQAMMRYSDNAAADYLMWRLGREQLAGLPAELGMPLEQAPMPFAGQFLSWQNTQLSDAPSKLVKRYQDMGAKSYADQVWSLFTQLHEGAGRSQAEKQRLEEDGMTLRLRDQAELAGVLGVRGRAGAYADLMARIDHGDLPGAGVARDALSWPLQNQEMSAQFEQIGTKGGSLPGLLTSVYFGRAKGHERTRVLALCFERLPIAVWLQLMQTFVHQKLELKLLSDDAFLARMRELVAQ